MNPKTFGAILGAQKTPSGIVRECGFMGNVCWLEPKRSGFNSLPHYLLIFFTLSEPPISLLQTEDHGANFVIPLENFKYVLRVSVTVLDTNKASKKAGLPSLSFSK